MKSALIFIRVILYVTLDGIGVDKIILDPDEEYIRHCRFIFILSVKSADVHSVYSPRVLP